MKEQQILQLKCIDINHEGLGVVKADDFTIFVPNLLVGEEAKIRVNQIKKSFAFGEVVEYISYSKERVNPICKHFFKCGGCDLMHMNYESQLKFKLSMANATFKRIGHLDFEIKNIIGMENPYEYRNKVQMPIGKKNGKIITGFYKKKSHDIIELDKCYIQPSLSTDITKLVKNVANDLKIQAYDEVNKNGCLRHVIVRKTFCGEYMIVLVVFDDSKQNLYLLKELTERVVNRYSEVKSVILNVNKKINNVILGDSYKTLFGSDILIEEILGLKFRMSHKAFFQINLKQTEKLYSKALEYANINKEDIVLDCYCGVGTISLLASKKAKKVYGIEVVSEAINDAIENSKLNNINNAEFIVGKAEEKILEFKDKEIDVMIVDPPRKGLDINVVNTIKQKKIRKIVYVSCDIATLARDLSLLSDMYKIDDVTLVDMFPQTADVETVVLLSRKKVNDRINFDINIEALPDRVSKTATYAEIKAYVLEHYGLKVSSLYIAQIKEKHGIKERENYNIGEGKSKELICPPEKEEAITNALKHFNMI